MDFLIGGASTTGSALDIAAGTIAGSTIGSEMDSIGDRNGLNRRYNSWLNRHRY